MDKNIIMFVTNALMSSDTQINYIDQQHNKLGGNVGSSIKMIAGEIKNKIKPESCDDLIRSISNICETINCNNIISSILYIFLKNLCHHMPIYDLSMNNFIMNHLHNDIIEISDDDDDDYDVNGANNVNIGVFDFTVRWISILKSAIFDMDSFESFCDCEQIENNSYNHLIYDGFLDGFKCSFEMMNSKSPDILNLTEAIEDLAQNGYKTFAIDLNFRSLFNENKPNPILQILATTFRAIVEAIKIS